MNLRLKWMLLFVFCFGLIGVRSVYVSFEDRKSRGYIRGDWQSDRNAYSAVVYFYHHGFAAAKYRPVHGYVTKGEITPDNVYHYTHYPALPDYVIAVGAYIFSSTDESVLRILPTLISCLSFFLIIVICRIFFRDPEQLFWTVALLVMSGYFIYWADTFYKHVYEILFAWVWIGLLYLFYNKMQKQYLWVFGAPIAFLTMNSSYEAAIYAIVLIVGCSLAFEKGYKKLFAPINFYLAIFFVAGFGFHMAMNAYALGGFEQMWADVTKAYAHRTGMSKEHADGFEYWNILVSPINFISRLERYFFVPGYALLVFFIWRLNQLRVEGRDIERKWLLITCAAGFAWYLIMPQHAKIHHFTARHFGPTAALIMVPGLLELKARWLQAKASGNKKMLFLYGFLAFYIFAFAVTQVLVPVWWTHSLAKLF